MKSEGAPILVVFGENAKIGVGKDHLESTANHMSPHNKISAIAAGIVATHTLYDSDVWFVGCDPYGLGQEEAVLAENYAKNRFPRLEGRTTTINGYLDTSLQAEEIARRLKELGQEGRAVNVVVPIEHERRAVGQLRANGVNVTDVFESNKTYVGDPDLTHASRKRRINFVRGLYSKPETYLDLMREFGLNLIGKIDNRGLLIRNISKTFRKEK